MSREKNLAKNTLIITIGTISTKMLSFFLLPLYTGVLQTEEYGIVDLFNTIINFLIPIITLELHQGMFKYLTENRENLNEKKKIISTTLVFTFFIIIVYSIIFLIFNTFIKNEYKYFLAINLILSIWYNVLLQMTRGLGNNKKYAFSSFIFSLVNILLNIFFLLIVKIRVEGMFSAVLIANVIGIIYLIFSQKAFRYISTTCFEKETLKRLLKYSIPLIPNQISWWIFGSSDRVIVSALLGLSFTGILSVSYKFSGAYILLYNIFNLSWQESVIIHVRDKDFKEYFNKVFYIVFKFLMAVGFAIIAMLPFVFEILINNEYSMAYYIIPMLMISSIFQVIMGLVSVIYAPHNNTKAIAKTALLSAIVNILVHLGLIKFIGIYAAAVSTLISYIIFALFRILDVNKQYVKINFQKKFWISSFLILMLILIGYYTKCLVINIIALLITSIYSWLINKNSLKTILRMILKKNKISNN